MSSPVANVSRETGTNGGLLHGRKEKKPARKWAGEIRLDSLLEYCCGTFALLLLRSIAAGKLLKRRREKEMLPRLLPALSSPLLFAKKGEGEEKEGMCDIYREADI